MPPENYADYAADRRAKQQAKGPTTKVTIFLVWYYATTQDQLKGKKTLYDVKGTRKEANKAKGDCSIGRHPVGVWIQQKTLNATTKV
ncbi:TPA: hypothetical protein P0E30_003747 [Vibrio harveyi]|nr:hypothetical protein [Vibrio harveyi]